MKCWGDNSGGGLGNGGGSDQDTGVFVNGLSGVRQLSASESPCVVLGNRTVKCWGPGSSGQLGNGHDNEADVPVRVKNLNDVRQVSSGYLHACAVLLSGRVKCWGDNADGQLGDHSNDPSNVPVKVVGIKDAVEVDAGDEYSTCARLADGSARCWGYNSDGQLGNNSSNDSNVPVKVKQLDPIRRIIGGYYEATAPSP